MGPPVRLSVRLLVLLLILAAPAPRELSAAVDRWSYLASAPGGRVGSLVVSPTRPSVIYASSGALFKSADGGANWAPVYLQDTTGAVAVHPADADIAYLVTGREGHLEVTTDGGVSWQEPSPTWTAFGARLVTSPAEPAALYAHYGLGLEKTLDGGRTWQILTGAPGLESLRTVIDLEADPRRAGTLYLLGATTSGILSGWFSADGGAAWRSFPPPAGAVTDLAVDPTRPGSLLAVNGTGSVWVTSDLGRTWRRPSTTALPSGLSRVWVGAGATPLFLVSDGTRLFASRDGGRHYEEAPAPLPRAHLAVAFDPTSAETFYLGLDQGPDQGGVLPTRDGGRHFEPNTLSGGPLGAPIAHPQRPGTLFALSAGGLVRSFDGGRSWERAPVDPPGSTVWGLGIAFGPRPALFASLPIGILLSRDDGATWSHVCQPCLRVTTFLTTPADPGLVFAASPFEPTRSWRSLDGGESWEQVPFVPLALDPRDPQALYRKLAGTSGDLLERSADGGGHWLDAGSGLHEDLVVYTLSAHPGGDSRRLWLGTDEGLYRSDDGAASWQRVWFESEAHDVLALGLDPSDPDTVLAVALELGAPPDLENARILTSRDGGESWSTGDLPRLSSGARLTGDPRHPGTFLASSAGNLYALTLRSPSACAIDDTTLCLGQGRFRARVAWRDFEGNTGDGHGAPLTDDTGAFWFFDRDNLELAVKALDGTALNGHFWLFYGALSNVAYTLDVVDTATGEPRTYFNPLYSLASRGDTLAFAMSTGSTGPSAAEDDRTHPVPAATAACAPGSTTLCLNGGRFQVEVDWEDFQGGAGPGHADPVTPDTGTFWFFDPRNVEVVVKVLDGGPINEHFWVFYGALSNVGYTLTVTDSATGAVRVYDNPSGRFLSRADTAAF